MVSEDVRWLTDDELSAWLSLTAVISLLPAELDSRMQRAHGTTHFEYVALAMLSEAPNRALPLKTLAAAAGGSLSRVSHVVTRLGRRGWVRRSPLPNDGRVTIATLTAEGMDQVERCAPTHLESARQLVFDRLSQTQVSQLRRIALSLVTTLVPDGLDPDEFLGRLANPRG